MGYFLNLTFDIEPSDMRKNTRDTQGFFLKFDRRHESILETAWDMAIQATRVMRDFTH